MRGFGTDKEEGVQNPKNLTGVICERPLMNHLPENVVTIVSAMSYQNWKILISNYVDISPYSSTSTGYMVLKSTSPEPKREVCSSDTQKCHRNVLNAKIRQYSTRFLVLPFCNFIEFGIFT